MTAPLPEELMDNALLAILRENDRRLLAPHMVKVEMKAKDVLRNAGDEVTDTWFPCGSAMASFTVWIEEAGSSVEVALVGREGAIGGIVSNGKLPAFATSCVRSGGRFLRIKTTALEAAKVESIALRHWFSRYSDCLFAQVFQTAACNASHTIEQRAAKWLLAAMARTSSPQLELTHEELAQMLGVGRSFISRVVRQLREAGVLVTQRGKFTVTNTEALRNLSCRCTSAIEDHFDRVLHGIYPLE